MAPFNYHLSDVSDQDAITNVTHICIIPQFILTKQTLSPFLTTLWDHTDGCANHYCCASAIYLLSCIALEFSIIIDRTVIEPWYGKYVIDGLNAR